MDEPLIPKHGGYRKLKTFQLARLVFDLTDYFVRHFIPKTSRTCDQMIQAARSGVQNIAEGSQFSATSKKLELKLTNAARSSLEELRLDYEDYLRQRKYPQWDTDHAALKRFRARHYSCLEEVLQWCDAEMALARANLEKRSSQNPSPEGVHAGPCPSIPLANAALALLNLVCHLLDKQIQAQANAFEAEGGFTEKLYRTRASRRKRN
ncbi:MAG: four helix bundle protein [Armatimonadetes bacterium]|nr:four helix bundle protein [Armatimonadota bacterium]